MHNGRLGRLHIEHIFYGKTHQDIFDSMLKKGDRVCAEIERIREYGPTATVYNLPVRSSSLTNRHLLDAIEKCLALKRRYWNTPRSW